MGFWNSQINFANGTETTLIIFCLYSVRKEYICCYVALSENLIFHTKFPTLVNMQISFNDDQCITFWSSLCGISFFGVLVPFENIIDGKKDVQPLQ